MEFKRELTLWEKRLRINFDEINANECTIDLLLKKKLAETINSIDNIEQKNGEHGRLKSIALTEIENTSMWITKSLTYEI